MAVITTEEKMTEQLCLPEPYGAKCISGTHISIVGDPLPGYLHDEMSNLLHGYGCPLDMGILDRAMASLEHSGRYDCFVVLDRSARKLLAEELRQMNYRLDEWRWQDEERWKWLD